MKRSSNAAGTALINTPLQWGVNNGEDFANRFNGFPPAEQTVETVEFANHSSGTPLKWGVNEMSGSRPDSEIRPSITLPLLEACSTVALQIYLSALMPD